MPIFQLSEPTIFPDLNQRLGRDLNDTTAEIDLKSLKYKHFREVVKFPEAEQMHHLMLAVTELSENDLGELTPKDAAGISEYIFNAMREYFELGKKIIHDMSSQESK